MRCWSCQGVMCQCHCQPADFIQRLPLPAWWLHAVIADNKAIGPDETVELSRDLKVERLAAPSIEWYHLVRAFSNELAILQRML